MRLDGFGLFVEDMARMIRFYRDVLGFEIKESEDTSNVYLVKDGTLFLLYGRKDFENMTHRRYEYIKGLNGHSEMALYVDTFEEEPPIDIVALSKEMQDIDQKIAQSEAEFLSLVDDLDVNEHTQSTIDAIKAVFKHD